MKTLYRSCIVLFYAMVILLSDNANAQTILLYQNDFETPLTSPVENCGPDLDANPVNSLYAGTGQGTGGGGIFQQVNTVETMLIHGPSNQYLDPTGLGGNYCISMLSELQEDRMALILNTQGLPFANITLHLSPIDLAGCGGPFELDTAYLRITVYDSPGATFFFESPGTTLDEALIAGGAPGETPYTFNWLQCLANLEVANATDGYITIVFDLINAGYAAIDNISISSSISALLPEVQQAQNKVNAYPNPFSDQVTINGTAAGGQWMILDTRGLVLHSGLSTTSATVIDTADLAAGIYSIRYQEKNESKIMKLLKVQ